MAYARVYNRPCHGVTSLLLASWLLTQHWAWDKSPETDVVSYRIRWGASGTAWCAANRVEIPATACGVVACGELNVCCGEIPMPTYTPAYIAVTAVDDAGLESQTEHGEVVSCP